MKSIRWMVGVCILGVLAAWLVQAQGQEVDITGYYTPDGMKDGEFERHPQVAAESRAGNLGSGYSNP